MAARGCWYYSLCPGDHTVIAIWQFANRASPASLRRPLRRRARRRKNHAQTRGRRPPHAENFPPSSDDVGGVTPPLPHPSHSARGVIATRRQADLHGSSKQSLPRRTTSPGVGTTSLAYPPREPLRTTCRGARPGSSIGGTYLAIGTSVCCGETGPQNRRMRNGEPTGSRVMK
jgi:hypothetical protein